MHNSFNYFRGRGLHITRDLFERLTVTSILCYGGAVGFGRGNPLLLLEDIEEFSVEVTLLSSSVC
jgi:hypothetical protein